MPILSDEKGFKNNDYLVVIRQKLFYILNKILSYIITSFPQKICKNIKKSQPKISQGGKIPLSLWKNFISYKIPIFRDLPNSTYNYIYTRPLLHNSIQSKRLSLTSKLFGSLLTKYCMSQFPHFNLLLLVMGKLTKVTPCIYDVPGLEYKLFL